MAQQVVVASTIKEEAEAEEEVVVEGDSMMVPEAEGLAVPAVHPRLLLWHVLVLTETARRREHASSCNYQTSNRCAASPSRRGISD
jgi:hypothetical protein